MKRSKNRFYRSRNFKIGIILLLVSLLGAGCKDNEQDPLCYKGKVISLNQGNGCNNILEIVETVKNDELPIGSTIFFDPTLFSKKLNEGDVVYFKIIQYEKWVGFANADCLWPQFTGQIEFNKD